MAHVSHKLSGALEGALAGGGDPATSPLYVFGPFLRLLVTAGAASVAFGTSIWLAIITVVAVSAMYRLVMIWVTDGSGGSGLNEEELGPWAVKINAGITVIEYTLTFLVSMAALVTFVADRLPALRESVLGIPLRTLLAIALSVLTGALVNRGPKVAARAFGPATAAVLILLWVMVGATIWRFGFRLPSFDLAAFSGQYIHVTLGGYARILALMTGIEIFANLVAAYRGPARERSRMAFGSLVIVMATTSITMIIVGPAIHDLANPLDEHVSVFTQTMDQLLPPWLAYTGSLVGIAVLLSAAAASAQGIQNLALGMRYRHYIPALLGQRNKYAVAARPVWLQVAVCTLCFALIGTHEETYLALYAAGVFILLSLTGWSAVKRLVRQVREAPGARAALALAGTLVAAILTTGATAIIFEERFFEGAWMYLFLVPALYLVFGRYRSKLGSPPAVEDRLGRVLSSSYLPPTTSAALYSGVRFQNILVPLDQSPLAEPAIALAQTLGRAYGAKLTLLSVAPKPDDDEEPKPDAPTMASARDYLGQVAEQLTTVGHPVAIEVREGDPAEQIGAVARSGDVDAVVMSTHGRARWQRWLARSITSDVIYQTTPPLLVVRPTESWRSTRSRFSRLLVALDGSTTAEQVLPHVHALAKTFGSEVVLLSVAEGSESDEYAGKAQAYLERVAEPIRAHGKLVRVLTETGPPAQTIVRVAETEQADLVMMVSHGRGGVARQEHVKLGSTTDLVVREAPCPVFLVSATPEPNVAGSSAEEPKREARSSAEEPKQEER